MDIQWDEKKSVTFESSYSTRTETVDNYSRQEILSYDMESEVEGPVLVNTAIEIGKECEGLEIGTEFNSEYVEMSSQYVSESEIVDIGFVKESDTVDFNVSVESKSIEVGSETFGEKSKMTMDSLTAYEAMTAMSDTCCEFICTMVDSESHSETLFVDDLWSQEDGKTCDVSIEIMSTTVESSCECGVDMSETGIEAVKKTHDIGIESGVMVMVEGSSSNEISCISIDCERLDVVEEIVAETEESQKSIVMRTEDEWIGCVVLMSDISTVVECKIVDASVEMEMKCEEYGTQWIEEIKRVDEVVETEKTDVVEQSISSDHDYCLIDFGYEGSTVTFTSQCLDIYPNSVCFSSFSQIDSSCTNISTYLSTIPLQDIGVQINILIPCSDFSQNTVEFETISEIDFEDDISQTSTRQSDGFEWAEVGLGLDIFPIEIETQTSDIVLCDLSTSYEIIYAESVFSTTIESTIVSSISTDCSADEKEYILQYVRNNVNSEIIKTIREMVDEKQPMKHSECQTDNKFELIDWVVDTFGINELNTFFRQDKYLVEESQNTDSIISRSVFTQSDVKEFNDIVTIHRAPIVISLSSTYEEIDDKQTTTLNIVEEIVENIIYETDGIDLPQNIECHTQTNVIETRAAGLQTIICQREHVSIVSEANYRDEYLFGEFDDIIDEVNFESETNYRRSVHGTIVSDNEAQTECYNRSCAVQTSINVTELLHISTIVDLMDDTLDNAVDRFIGNMNRQTQTSYSVMNSSNLSQTNPIDIYEPYWDNVVSHVLETFAKSQRAYVTTLDAGTLTEQVYIDHFYQVPVTSAHSRMMEEVQTHDLRFLTPTLRSQTTLSSDHMITMDREISLSSKVRYSSVTESSQTEAHLFTDDLESVFADEGNRGTRYTMTTSTRNTTLQEVIDSSIPLPITIRNVCHPSFRNMYSYNIALSRGWIDKERGVYYNPMTSETMSLERAVELKKIELAPETKCPNIRRVGLYKERSITKIEKIRVKDVLNTETGDLYDERTAKENQLLSDDGEFYDKEANAHILFQDAVLQNYIDIYEDNEIIDTTVDSEECFQITHVCDTAKGLWYDFHLACAKGLVSVKETMFRDTERSCNITFDEAIQRGMIQGKTITNLEHLYPENEAEERVIRQQMSLSSESYTSRPLSFISTDISGLQ